jgi:hypothetical protein
MNQRQPIYALQEGIDKLLGRHKQAWAELWKTGDIQIEGDLDAQQRVRFALYNLYSFIRPEPDRALLLWACRLDTMDIFLDSELWMYRLFWPCNPIWQNLARLPF